MSWLVIWGENGYAKRPTKKKFMLLSSRLLQSLFPLQIMKRKFCGKRKKDRQKSPFTHFLYRHGKGAIPQTAKANCVFQLQTLYVNDTQAGFRQGNLRICITVRIHNKVHFSETKIKKKLKWRNYYYKLQRQKHSEQESSSPEAVGRPRPSTYNPVPTKRT